MLARVVGGIAALILALSLVGIRWSDDVPSLALGLASGAPATLYRPPDAASVPGPRPVVVLAHGFAANRATLGTLARHLARAGYAALALDLRGHGASPLPFRDAAALPVGLLDDIQAALLLVGSRPELDASSVSLLGHSMGARAVLEYASREAGLSAVVAISGGAPPAGPYASNNVLLLWASGDADALKAELRALGQALAGVQQVVVERTYGDPGRGTAVRLSEVSGVDHLSVIYARETARRVIEWLDAATGNGPHEPPEFDPRHAFGLLGLAASAVLLATVARRGLGVGTGTSVPQRSGIRSLGWLGAGLLGALLVLAAAGERGPLAFLPLTGGRDVAGFLAISGLTLLVPGGPRPGSPSAGSAGRGVLLFGLAYLALGLCTAPFWDLWPAPHRLPWLAVCAGVVLPHFLALELHLRGHPGAWLPLAARTLTLLVLALGAFTGLLHPVFRLAVPILVGSFALLELVAWNLWRGAPDVWASALFQALLTGWLLAVIFPIG